MKYYYCTCQPNVACSVAIKVECNGWSLIVSLHHLSSLFNINYLVIHSNLSPSYRCLNCICVDVMNSLKQLRGPLIVFSIADHDYRYYLVIIRKVVYDTNDVKGVMLFSNSSPFILPPLVT